MSHETSLLEEAWKGREEVIYDSLFSNMPEQIYSPVDPKQVAIGGEALVLSGAGVFEVPPSDERTYWTYITSGLSNPFEDKPEEFSGFGFELLIRSPEQSFWAIHFLFNLMGYVFETGNLFGMGHRIPLNGPISKDTDSQLNTVLFWSPEGLPSSFTLKSGNFELLDIIGITEAEYQYALKNSSEDLFNLLKEKLPCFPLTDITRNSCI